MSTQDLHRFQQIVLADDVHHVCVLGHHPERIEIFGFDFGKRQVGAQPSKPGQQRFLLCISFRRGDQASEALGYFSASGILPLALASIACSRA